MSESVATQVLIVGAGPTGLMLACQLARFGIPFEIVDRNAGPVTETRALGVQARTLEIYARLGIAQDAIARGHRTEAAQLWVERGRAARIPVGQIGQHLTPFPFLLILPQDDNERLLIRRLQEEGHSVQRETVLTGLQLHADHAIATLQTADGSTRTVSAGWVAGCDGAHSTVRQACGIGFPGAPYEDSFFLADVRARGPMIPGELNVFLWRHGFHAFFPLPGEDHFRIVSLVPPELRSRDSLSLDDLLPALRARMGTDFSVEECVWFSQYRIHHRRADRFRSGRCFLLGDAAHIHSPVGAQGMNTGLQDAYNLAWKLALEVQGRAGESLLDSYEAERIPVAERLLKTTDRAFSLVTSDSGLAALLRMRIAPRVLSLAMRSERMRRLAFRGISQTGINYRGGPLSQDLDGHRSGLRAGDRFPLGSFAWEDGITQSVLDRVDDRCFTLLLCGRETMRRREAVAIGLPDSFMRIDGIPAEAANVRAFNRHELEDSGFYLLRPDGHVAICGPQFDAQAVSSHLRTRLALTV